MDRINLLGGLPGHERKGGGFQTGYSVYGADGISPALLANGGGYGIMVIEENPVLIGGAQKHQSVKTDGVCTALNTMQGGGREPHIVAMRGRNPGNPNSREKGLATEQRLEMKMDGTSNILTTVQKDNLVLEENIIKVGQISNEGSQCGTVVSGKGLFPTVCAGTHGYGNPHVAAETDIKERFFRQAAETMEKGNAAPGDTVDAFNRKVNRSGVSPTLTTRPEGFKTAILPVVEARPKAAAAPLHSDCLRKYRIRKLTPKECFRLMAVTDNDADKMLSVNSNSQCYKQAGNSIVVSVLEAIFRQLNIKGVEAWNKEKVA